MAVAGRRAPQGGVGGQQRGELEERASFQQQQPARRGAIGVTAVMWSAKPRIALETLLR
jgi:hypothetical protein